MIRERVKTGVISPDKRKRTFEEVESGLKEDIAVEEARRCLTCEVEKCIGCKICAEVCPDGIIFVETEKNKDGIEYPSDYKIDITRCMFCGLCTEVCPTKTLHTTDRYEFSKYNKDELVFDMMKESRDN